ncbi:hypothetical protein CRUP_010163, partial [Coryphaenoides rupestris]
AQPCLNGGLCLSTWDDFSCACPVHTAGRRCEEVRWCETSPCPAGSECRTLLRGYECYGNVSILNDSSVLRYQGNGHISRDITSLSLSLRTRTRHAVLLHAERGSAFITVSLQDGLLCVELQSHVGGEQEEQKEEEEEEEELSAVSLKSRRLVSDGEWHSVELFMTAPWTQRPRWSLVLDGDTDQASTSAASGAGGGSSLNFLRRDVDIFLGGLAPGTGWGLVGCLGPVELGGVTLPYFPVAPSPPAAQQQEEEEGFVRTSGAPPRAGCTGAAVCQPNPCLNGGLCRDLFNLHRCGCPRGWAGRYCGVSNTDACASGPCVHGNCSVGGLGYECACDFGYAGATCEAEADVCEGHLCAHGATCLQGPDRYACLCAENYTGPLCK